MSRSGGVWPASSWQFMASQQLAVMEDDLSELECHSSVS